MRYILLVLAMLAVPVSADATNPRSVGYVLPQCEAALRNVNDPQALPCIMYIGGVSDVVTSNVLDTRIIPACTPPGTTTADIVRTFVNWANRNPDFWHEDVFRGLIAALIESYPC